ncbi:hypothetical protein L21SP2_0680 [Salinispira pacifica]|uniref:Uncharacterized protein n=1 Tax=Salinispira pacifica TaxID=1307761 RepID=V5WE88_9SPIO|nr:hypothetical protein L21SP2_0680 [Salinispira pacifica]
MVFNDNTIYIAYDDAVEVGATGKTLAAKTYKKHKLYGVQAEFSLK